MNKILLYFTAISVWIISGCGQSEKELEFIPPVFQNTKHLEGKILVDTFVMGLCYDIDYYKDYLIVSGYRGDGELLNFFDKNNGKYIKSMFRKGRGAGEVLCLKDFDIDHSNGNVLFYDFMSKKLVNFNIDSVLLHQNIINYIHAQDYPIYMYKILQGNDCYIAEGGYKDNGKNVRLSIIENDSAVYKYYKFPHVKIPGTDAEGIVPAYIYGSRITISPDKKQIAYTTNYGAILEIFDVNSKKIKPKIIKGFYRPTYSLDKNKNIILIPEETIWGFFDLYAGNKYIYTIFSGSKNARETNIGVFDWNGNCISLYTTDYQLEKICVDEKNHKIYANGLDKNFETVIVQFDL